MCSSDLTKDESLAIIDKDDRVHMAHMDIHFTHSTNGGNIGSAQIAERSLPIKN